MIFRFWGLLLFITVFFVDEMYAEFNGKVELGNSYFFNGSQNDDLIYWSYPSLYLKSTYEKETDYSRWFFSTDIILSLLTEKNNMYGIPEFGYLKKSSNYYLEFGRVLKNWMLIDSQWKLGVFNPLVRWDKLNPIEQGLTGFFWGSKWGEIKTRLFVSALFLPNQDPQLEIANGKVESNSPWTDDVVSEINLPNDSKQLYYTLLTPEITKVILRPQFLFQLTLPSKTDKRSLTQFIVGFKPINALAVGFRLDETDTDLNDGKEKVKITPLVAYHSLLGIELKRQILSLHKVNFSLLWERPQFFDNSLMVDERPSDWFYPILKERLYLSWGAWAYSSLFNWPLDLELSYLHTAELSDITKDNDLSGSSLSASGQQTLDSLLYLQAIKLAGRLHFSSGANVLIAYIFDFKQSGGHLLVDLNYNINSYFRLNFAAELLGVATNTAEEKTSGFINNFKTNDRLHLGVGYEF